MCFEVISNLSGLYPLIEHEAELPYQIPPVIARFLSLLRLVHREVLLEGLLKGRVLEEDVLGAFLSFHLLLSLEQS